MIFSKGPTLTSMVLSKCHIDMYAYVKFVIRTVSIVLPFNCSFEIT